MYKEQGKSEPPPCPHLPAPLLSAHGFFACPLTLSLPCQDSDLDGLYLRKHDASDTPNHEIGNCFFMLLNSQSVTRCLSYFKGIFSHLGGSSQDLTLHTLHFLLEQSFFPRHSTFLFVCLLSCFGVFLGLRSIDCLEKRGHLSCRVALVLDLAVCLLCGVWNLWVV